MSATKIHTYHRFLDEAGDTTFFGKGGVELIGQEGVSKAFMIGMVRFKRDFIPKGVSKAFMIGMVRFKRDFIPIREKIIELQNSVVNDSYFSSVPSIQKKINNGGFFFHAKDDVPEVRKIFFDFLKSIDFSCEVVVGRKIPKLFISKHNGKDNEFYADLLSHLLKSKLKGDKLVLNVSERGSSTRAKTLTLALEKAQERFVRKHGSGASTCAVHFNVQTPTIDPLLSVPDYILWSIQRIFERGETRYYDFLKDKIPLIIDIYDSSKYKDWGNYYNPSKPLTSDNKI